MRRLLVVLVPLAASLGFAGTALEPRFDPRFANIVAACTPGDAPAVQPVRVTMTRQDSVVWREVSGRAASWTITPKNAEDWLFDQAAFTGTPQAPAVTRRPRAGAQPGHPYAYNVRIVCSDGSVQNIDPDIIIGEAQDP